MRQLRDRRSLDLLMLGSLSTASLDIPTWLNWSVPTEIRRLRSGEAAAGAWAVGHYAGDGILETTGLYVATICQVRLENGIWSNEVSRSTAREAIENVLRKVIGSVHIAVAILKSAAKHQSIAHLSLGDRAPRLMDGHRMCHDAKEI